MFLKAQRDTEMSVLDRQRPPDSQYLATKPPAGPGYTKPRDEVGFRREEALHTRVKCFAKQTP